MNYWILAMIFFVIILFDVVLIVSFFTRTNSKQGIYVNRIYSVLPLFMIVVGTFVFLFGFTKSRYNEYSNDIILSGLLFCFLFIAIGSLLLYLMFSWHVNFYDDHVLYSNYVGKKKKIMYGSIEHIDAFRPTSNGIVHIKTAEGITKINHHILQGDISRLTELIHKYRKN